LIHWQRGELHDLFAAAIANSKTQCAVARPRRQEEVMRGVVSKIENTLPVPAAVPIHPRSKTERIAPRDIRRKCDVAVRAIEGERLSVVTVGEDGRHCGHSAVAETGTVERVVFKT